MIWSITKQIAFVVGFNTKNKIEQPPKKSFMTTNKP